MSDQPEAATAAVSEVAIGSPTDGRLRYRLLTGPDDHQFCARVSEAIEDGYVLHGSPSIAVGPDGPVVCQALILP